MGESIKLEKVCKSVGSQILRTLHALNETRKKILKKNLTVCISKMHTASSNFVFLISWHFLKTSFVK